MKLQLDKTPGIRLFTAYGEDYVAIDQIKHQNNLILVGEQLIERWTTADIQRFAAPEIETLLALDVEVILLGTGQRLRFPTPGLLAPFTQARRGIEIMDIPAACRTYNILATEGRNVAAALLFDDAR